MEKTVDFIWRNCLTEPGSFKPLFVISVIGDSISVVPSTWEKSNFQNSLIDAAIGADECWIFHKDGKGKLSYAVKEAVDNYLKVTNEGSGGNTLAIFSGKKGSKGKIKLYGMLPREMDNFEPDVTCRTVKEGEHKLIHVPKTSYIHIHVELLKKIAQERVNILNHNKKERTIRTAVIVVVAEGDLDTIHHVDTILQHGLPVVIIKGSGKASDVIVEYLEHGKEVLKSDASLLLGTYTTLDSLENFAAKMKSIKAMKHLISIYDVNDPCERSLSEVATDAVLRSWSVMNLGKSKSRRVSSSLSVFDSRTASQTDELLRTSKDSIYSVKDMLAVSERQSSISPINSLGIIPQTDIGSRLLEKFGGATWHIPSSFSLYFYAAYQIIQQRFLNDEATKKSLINDLFGKAIIADNLTYVSVLLHEHNAELDLSQLPKLYEDIVKCKLCTKDESCQHFYSVLESISEASSLFEHKPEECVNGGREICAVLLHYPRQNDSKVVAADVMASGISKVWQDFLLAVFFFNVMFRRQPVNNLVAILANNPKVKEKTVSYQDLLIWALFANRPQLAEIFWKASENQMLAALLAYGVLKKMAAIAKETADQSVHKELLEHAKIFEKRSLDMQQELYKKYPSKAMELMTTNLEVWDIKIKPLKCAYYNDMYEFIADPCSQRCLNKIWYNNLGTNVVTALKKSLGWGRFQGRSYGLCKLLSAPFTKYLVNYLVFFVAMVIYSAFLLTNLERANIKAFEYFVYAWMASDIVEEYLVPMLKKKRSTETLQLSKRRADVWYRFGRYINNFWNVLDTLSYLLTFTAVILRYSCDCMKWARRVYSFSLFLIYMRFLHVTLIYRKVGVYVILIKEMMKDLARFIVILVVFMLAIGVMYHVNKWPDHKKMWSSDIEKWRIWQIMYLPYWQIYGEVSLDLVVGAGGSSNDSCCNYVDSGFGTEGDTCYGDIDKCRENDDGILIVIAAFYMLLSNLLLVNLVIALFSARFEKVRTNSEKIWRYIRYSYILDYRIRVPAGLNIVLRPIMIMYWCCCKRPICCKRRVDKHDGPSEDEQLKTLQSLCAVRCS